MGVVREVGPLFPETANANVVGDAVVRAVQLEKCGAKGPRLLVSDEVVGALPAEFTSWMLDQTAEGPAELLWLLTPDPKVTEPLMVADVCRVGTRLLATQSQDAAAAPHLVAYIDLIARSLERLRQRDAHAADATLALVDFSAVRPILQSLLSTSRIPEFLVLERIDALIGK